MCQIFKSSSLKKKKISGYVRFSSGKDVNVVYLKQLMHIYTAEV